VPRFARRTLRLGPLALLVLLAPALPAAPVTAPAVLWACERPEDLRFLAPGEAQVATLVATVTLREGGFGWRDQLNRHALRAATEPIVVVRLESTGRGALSRHERALLVEALATAARGQAELQLDYDAHRSERGSYRELLLALRRRLPPTTRLSITALASWCDGDRWLASTPIDEAVPMLFRMGAEGRAIRSRLAAGADLAEPLWRGSYGLATDEAWPPLRAGRRRWIFHPQGWDEDAVRAALARSFAP